MYSAKISVYQQIVQETMSCYTKSTKNYRLLVKRLYGSAGIIEILSLLGYCG